MSTSVNVLDIEWVRGPDGKVLERIVEVPFRPEFLIFLTREGRYAPKMEWLEADPLDDALPMGPAHATAGVTGGVHAELEPLRAHRFSLDLRACAKFGFEPIDLARIELPVLDYASADPLTMKVHVRVRAVATEAEFITIYTAAGVDREWAEIAAGRYLRAGRFVSAEDVCAAAKQEKAAGDEEAAAWAEAGRLRHAAHGRGTDAGPDEPDCPCRPDASLRVECAAAGCGFCRCA